MKSNSQRGVALVITLIMLAMVTFMAVIFLGVSRRERASVTVTADQTDAKLMADAAMARAQAEVVVRMMARSNAFNYDLLVSTNYIHPLGYLPINFTDNYFRIGYTYENGTPLSGNDLQVMLAHLRYDPRPPVFVPTNNLGSNEIGRAHV